MDDTSAISVTNSDRRPSRFGKAAAVKLRRYLQELFADYGESYVQQYVTADREALMSVFSDPGKFYNADPFTFLIASLLLFIFGGAFFVDRLMDTVVGSRRTKSSSAVSTHAVAA